VSIEYDPQTGLPRERSRRFDLQDLRLIGFFAAALIALWVLAAALGLAVRIFLATSGLR
jgi:hypothetical protein